MTRRPPWRPCRHGHAHHHHAASARAVGIAALLTGGFMLAEVAGGLVSGSLALIADAGHMLTDFAALTMAWLAFRVARRPADARRTYGFDRISVMAAFVNGLALFAVAIWISSRPPAASPPPPRSRAASCWSSPPLGLVVNILAFRILSGGDRDNLNLRSALLHVPATSSAPPAPSSRRSSSSGPAGRPSTRSSRCWSRSSSSAPPGPWCAPAATSCSRPRPRASTPPPSAPTWPPPCRR